jgi:hypothetical protein
MASIVEVVASDLDAAKATLVPEAISALVNAMHSTDPKVNLDAAIAVLEFYGYRRKADPIQQNNFQQNMLQLPKDAFSDIAQHLAGLTQDIDDDKEDNE